MSTKQSGVGQELGLPDPDHDPAYERVRATLATTGADHMPRAGWERDVWAKIDANHAPNPRRLGGFVAGGLALCAAAILLLVWSPWRAAPRHATTAAMGGDVVAVITQIEGPAKRRAAGMYVNGDSIHVAYPVKGGVVWIYRGEKHLLLACTASPCEATASSTETYHVITAITSMAPPATLDGALAELTRSGARFKHQSIDVQ